MNLRFRFPVSRPAEYTADIMDRTAEDYKPVYAAAGAATGKLFAGLTVPGPDLIADLIVEAILSDAPKPVYEAGPFREELVARRGNLDDDSFHGLMMKKFNLKGLRV